MASAFHDRQRDTWTADYRPPNAGGKTRKRVRLTDVKGNTPKARERAIAFAKRCETLARAMEQSPTRAQIQEALSLGIIANDQADEALKGFGVIPKQRRLSLRDAFDSHPSTVREARNDGELHARHIRSLEAFAAASDIQFIDQLTMQAVLLWVEQLRRKGRKFETRRHDLIGVRRAARMGPTVGMPDPLNGFKLDSDDEPSGSEQVWTFDQRTAAAKVFRDGDDPRPLVVLAMGGFMGLCSSEIFRLQVGDVDTTLAILKVGVHGAKNKMRRRDLPIPPICVPWFARLTDGRLSDAHLIESKKGKRTYPLDRFRYPDFMRPRLAAATGLDLPPNMMRHSFATWCAHQRLDPLHYEAFMGHKSAEIADITHRNYLARSNAETLRPTAQEISNRIEAAIGSNS